MHSHNKNRILSLLILLLLIVSIGTTAASAFNFVQLDDKAGASSATNTAAAQSPAASTAANTTSAAGNVAPGATVESAVELTPIGGENAGSAGEASANGQSVQQAPKVDAITLTDVTAGGTTATGAATVPTEKLYGKTNIKGVNIRAWTTTKSAIVESFALTGTIFEIEEEVLSSTNDIWYRLIIDEKTEGYIRGDLVDLITVDEYVALGGVVEGYTADASVAVVGANAALTASTATTTTTTTTVAAQASAGATTAPQPGVSSPSADPNFVSAGAVPGDGTAVAPPAPTPVPQIFKKVWIQATGGTHYHKLTSCSEIADGKYLAKTPEQAIASGLLPCPVCNPGS